MYIPQIAIKVIRIPTRNTSNLGNRKWRIMVISIMPIDAMITPTIRSESILLEQFVFLYLFTGI